MDLFPHLAAEPLVLAIGATVAALLATLLVLVLRGRRNPGSVASDVPSPVVEQPPDEVARLTTFDSEALLSAVEEAEAENATHRLPQLYLSLAQWRLEEGAPRTAADLLRKCIRVATSAGLKEPHARARVALGDIAQDTGDPSTACEHWQIARLLFHELKQSRDYEAVDARMQRNKCPTDWVLTDF